MPSFQSILNSPISWDLAPSLPLYRWGNQLLTIQLQGLLKRYWLVSYKTQHPGNQEMNGQWAVIRKPNFLIYSIRSSDLIHSWEEFPLLACVPIHFSNAWLFTTLWTVAHQALLSVGFSRHEYWSGLPCSTSRGSFQPREWTCTSCCSCIAGRFFTTEPQRSPQ